MNKISKNLTLAALLLGLGGCAAQLEAEAPGTIGTDTESSADDSESVSTAAATLLASVDFADGRSVKFLEAEPGFLFTRERGPIGSARLYDPAEREHMDIVEWYEYLADAPAPQALIEAAARRGLPEAPEGRLEAIANETTFPRELRGPQSAHDGVAVDAQALSNDLTSSQFIDRYCPVIPPKVPQYYYRWVDVTGPGSVQRSDCEGFRAGAMAVRGTIHFVSKYRPWYTWKNLADTDISAGWYEFVAPDPAKDFDARATVSEADGDHYHLCVMIGL